jgi:beta-phosphoglucomutase-like phosphatase (HAD superfamily)
VSAPRALILDFNGTLSDDEPLLAKLFGAALAEEAGVEIPPAEFAQRFAGLSDPEVAESALRTVGIEPRPSLLDRILRAKIDGYLAAVEDDPPVPHASIEFVEEAAGRVPVAIASGAFREEVEYVLELSGIRDRFDAVVCLDDVAAGKPDPAVYVTALERINEVNGSAVAAAEVVAIEDTAAGVASAQEAGMRCAAMSGDERAEAVADFTIARLDGEAASRLLRS